MRQVIVARAVEYADDPVDATGMMVKDYRGKIGGGEPRTLSDPRHGNNPLAFPDPLDDFLEGEVFVLVGGGRTGDQRFGAEGLHAGDLLLQGRLVMRPALIFIPRYCFPKRRISFSGGCSESATMKAE